jgi:hypothetical protein
VRPGFRRIDTTLSMVEAHQGEVMGHSLKHR